MILIADSGGTSTSWALCGPEGVSLFDTCGFNAVHSPAGLLEDSVKGSALIDHTTDVDRILFYGAGCAGDKPLGRVRKELSRCFGHADIEIASDMLGAARALCGDTRGIACILGTGSNSCLYDGTGIIANTPPLGYILGDEGSGASLGKRFLGLLLKGHLPKEISEAFADRYPRLDTAEIIDRVYRRPAPNAFLASMCLFISSHATHPAINDFIVEEFRRFFRLNVSPYDGSRTLPVHFAGSVAAHFRPQLESAAEAEGYNIGTILASPLSGLIDYHSR